MPNQPSEHLTIETTPAVPPKTGRPRTQFYTEVAKKALATAPDWVVIRGYRSAATASNMRKGRYPAIDPADHEIEIRKSDDGETYDLYIRYVGKIVEK